MIGTIADGYKIQGKLGEGGVGEVYKALDLSLDCEVAVKVLRREFANDPHVSERFRAEAKTLAKLAHPNIARVYAMRRHGDALLMVMELVDGQSLERRLATSGPVDIGEAVALVAQAARGLAYAHGRGVVHRDIKPANLMLDRAGTLKITDFGIARMVGGGRLTRQGHVVGTVAYMAPEQIRGEDADGRCDIYALGIVLYELLTGDTPFAGDSEYEIMKSQVERPPLPLRLHRPDIPPVLEEIALKALQKAPDQRFQTSGEFLAALSSLRRDQGGAEGEDHRETQKGRDAQIGTSSRWSTRAALWASGPILVALAAVSAFYLPIFSPENRTPVAVPPSSTSVALAAPTAPNPTSPPVALPPPSMPSLPSMPVAPPQPSTELVPRPPPVQGQTTNIGRIQENPSSEQAAAPATAAGRPAAGHHVDEPLPPWLQQSPGQPRHADAGGSPTAPDQDSMPSPAAVLVPLPSAKPQKPRREQTTGTLRRETTRSHGWIVRGPVQ